MNYWGTESQNTLMILGASFLQVPMIQKARSLGYRTVVVDIDPSAPGVPYADEFCQVSTTDLEAVKEASKQWHLDGITTAATDMPVRVIAGLGAELGLPAITQQAALACTDKAVMIRVFAEAGVPHPLYGTAHDLASAKSQTERIGFPCIVKPVDSSGSRGVVLVQGPTEVSAALDYAYSSSRNGEVLVEEYLSGPEVSCEVFNDGDQVHILAVTDKCTSGPPHFVETGHSQPSRLSAEVIDGIKTVACAAVIALGITMGPAHVEIIVTNRGPVVVEVGARLGGDCITSHLVPLSTGIDLVGLVLNQAAGKPVTVPLAQKRASAIRFIEFPVGKLKHIKGLDAASRIEHVAEVVTLKQIGSISVGTHSSNDRLGYVVAEAELPEHAIDACNKAISVIEVEVE